MSGLSWAQLVDVGVAHVEHLADSENHEQWVVVSPDGASLVRVERYMDLYTAYVYRPGPRPSGGTSSMRDWVFDWQRVYDDAAQLLDDIAAIAG